MTGGGPSHLGLLVSGRFPELEDALCERVAELKHGRPLDPLTIVVGSTAVRTRVGDLLVRRLTAVANVTVTTLDGLARDLAAVSGGAPPAVPASVARERLVRRLVAAHASGLRYFGPVADKPHFAHALAATFADLRQAAVAPESAWAEEVAGGGLSGAGGASATRARAKAADLDRLYRAYCDQLAAHRLVDGAGVYQAAAATTRDGRGDGSGSQVILYGIYDLNQVQEAFAQTLVASGADVFVPAPRAGSAEAQTIRAVALSAGLGETSRDAPPPALDRDRIAALWAAADARAESPSFSGDGSLAVVSVADERAETREAVRAVVAAAEAGAPFASCAIVVPHGDDVARMAAALLAARVPVACRLPDRAVGRRALLRFADCVAPAVGEPFALRAVVDLFVAGAPSAAAAPPQASSLWLDEARRAGIVCGLDQWSERLGRRVRGLESKVRDLEGRVRQAQGDDDDAAQKLETATLRLQAASGLEAAVGALSRARGSLPSRASWGAWADALAAAAEMLFVPGVAAEAADSVARLRALSVLDEEVELAEVAAALRELLEGATVPAGRAGRDGVAVLTPLEVRGLSFHTVVFAGLAEGGFPVRGRPDPILGDAERRRVAEAQGVRLKLAEQRDAESLLLFGFACEAATRKLVLLSPRTDAATGRARLPSRILLRLASLAAGRPVGLDEFIEGGPLRPVWWHAGGSPGFTDDVVWVDARERDTAALLALSERERSSAVQGYLAAVLGGGAAVARRGGAWRASRSPEPGAWDGLLGSVARAALTGRHPFDAEMHPTRLERFISCPFAFLLRDVLGLDAPEEPGDALEMDPLEFGTLAHAILQRTYEQVIAGDLDLDGALTATAEAWRAGCAEAERRGVTGAALSWEVRSEMLLADLLESVRRDPVFTNGDGRPAGVEWRFGEAAERPVVLEAPGGRRVRFAGRLDRVDVTSWGARVIDYKSGAGGTEKARIKDGLSVQLPVYQLAVRQAGEEFGIAPVAGGGDGGGVISCLYRLVTRRGGFGDLELPDDETANVARLVEIVADTVALVDAGAFPRTTRGRCEYCDVSYACGVSAWARARKRQAPALAPIVRLQKPGAKGSPDGA